MNSNTKSVGLGRIIGGCLLGALLSLISSMLVVSEFMVPVTLVMLPAFALLFVYRFAGRGALTFTAVLQIVLNSFVAGTAYMYIMTLACVMPTLMVVRALDRGIPFFTQLKRSILLYAVGYLLAIVMGSVIVGGNLIKNLLSPLSELMRSMPQDYIAALLESVNSVTGLKLTAEQLLRVFDESVTQMITLLQVELPGHIFSGIVLTAVSVVTLGNRSRKGEENKGSYVSPRNWSLPANTVIGLLLTLGVSYGLYLMGLNNGMTVFFTVLCLNEAVFAIQMAASICRHARSTGLKITGIVLMIIGAVFGLQLWYLIYGVISAIFGSKGIAREYAKKNSGE